ncbi:MAG: response regulator with CheY-like receiver domain and winged-helix DNA-binding domain [Verrucomicrobiales bacterium]|nr:response regulator with CheY-like receiver domain and winged-helix DNA-binding domain [Verrucomicrobiales bacterium]
MNSPQSIILLAEDEVNDVLLMKRAFGKVKLINPVQVVSDGEQTIAYLQGQDPFQNREKYPLPMLILLDLKLPRRSGLEVLAWIRQQEAPVSRIPVVVLTSSKQTTDVNRAYELGANSYLVKPVTFEGLLEMVKALEMYWFILNEQPELTLTSRILADHATVSPSLVN